MMRWSRFGVIVLACMMVLVTVPRDVRARTADNWGFETGTLAGWSVLQEDNHVGVTGADAFAAPYWGSQMAVLGQPTSPVGAAHGKKLVMALANSGVPALETSRDLQPLKVKWGMNTIRREFTVNMTHLVFAYNVFSYFGSGLSRFAYSVSLLDGSGVIASSPSSAPNVGIGNRTMISSPSEVESSGWRVVDVDLSHYLYQQLAIEVSVESVMPFGTSDKGILAAYGPTWAYFDVNPPTPIIRADAMPEVRFVTPAVSGTTVAGTTADIVIEASDDHALADVRLLVNGVLAGQTMAPGLQTFHVSLQSGINTLQAVATDSTGKQVMVETTIYADAEGPVIVLSPISASVSSAVLTIEGTVRDAVSGLRSFAINDEPIIPFADGSFSEKLALMKGDNIVVVEAVDKAGNTTTRTFTVTYGGTFTAPPSIYVVLTIGSAEMQVNGMSQKIDAAPLIKDGRTLLPIRALIEALGGSVQWNASTKTATVMLGSRTVALTIGSEKALVNGSPVALDVPLMIVGGRTFLPLRAVAENLGLDLAWEPVSRTISFTYWP